MGLATIIIASLLLAAAVAFMIVKLLQRRADREQVYEEHMRALQQELEAPFDELKEALSQRRSDKNHLPISTRIVEVGLRIAQIKQEKRAGTRQAMIYRCRHALAELQKQFNALPEQPSVST